MINKIRNLKNIKLVKLKTWIEMMEKRVNNRWKLWGECSQRKTKVDIIWYAQWQTLLVPIWWHQTLLKGILDDGSGFRIEANAIKDHRKSWPLSCYENTAKLSYFNELKLLFVSILNKMLVCGFLIHRESYMES